MKNLASHFIFLSGLFCMLSVAFAQQPARIIINTEGDRHPWNNLDVNNDSENFQFAIVTDRTGGHRPGVFPVAIEKLNLLQPEFVMSVGDLIEGYTEDEQRIDTEWEEFTGFIADLTMPFFYVPGNHDYINEVMARKWKERFGKDYYSFVYKDVLFLCLNSEERMRGAGKGYIDDPQLTFIRETLEKHEDVTWTLVFLHQPLWDQQNNGKWAEVEELLSNRKHTVYAGHRHRYVKYDRNNSNYYILATTGGGSGLRGPRFGEFDHVVWITMTPQGPIMANLLLEGIWDSDVQTEEGYAFSRPLMGKLPLNMEPWLLEKPVFTKGELAFKIENTSDVPMEAALQFGSHEKLWLKSNDVKQTIAPNSVEFVRIPVESVGNLKSEEIEPLQLQAKFNYMPEKFPELQIAQSFRFKPQKQYALTQSRTIHLDGHLKEWGELKYDVSEHACIDSDPFSHQGPEDGSFRFDTYYDKDFVYVGIQVKDDDLVAEAGKRVFDQDAVGVIVDGRPVKESGGAINGRNLTIAWAQGGTGEAVLFRPDRLPEGVKVVSQLAEGGYSAEVAIPISYLKSLQGNDHWEHIRLNLVFRDLDKNGIHESEIFWNPDWSSEENILGSGIFRRK